MDDVRYAGFWLRFVAYLVDGVLLWVVNLIIGLLFGNTAGLGAASIIEVVFAWLYFSLMESSSTQATLGKMLLGIKVTTLDGERIGFGRATGRYFGKILSGLILCIGYMMAGWTSQKQALHDMIASTLVVKK